MELKSDEIKKIIPHRYPFWLIDKVTDMKLGERVEAIKCVSANEMYFMGHFPQKQIMPGVLIIEALAQAGAVAILSIPRNEGKVAVFGGIKNCRFRRQVTPGDVLHLYCEISQIRGTVGFGKAMAKVDGEIAVQGEITFAITE